MTNTFKILKINCKYHEDLLDAIIGYAQVFDSSILTLLSLCFLELSKHLIRLSKTFMTLSKTFSVLSTSTFFVSSGRTALIIRFFSTTTFKVFECLPVNHLKNCLIHQSSALPYLQQQM